MKGIGSSGPSPTVTHTVQPGDSLASVAAEFGVTRQAIIDANKDKYPSIAQPSKTNRLQVGWVLVIPTDRNVQAAAVQPTVVATGEGAAVVVEVTSTPGPALDANDGWFDYEAALEIVRLTNEERAKYSLSPLAIDETLMEIARKRAMEIVTDWGHQGLQDEACNCGENATKSDWLNKPADALFIEWIKSEGHHQNMLMTSYANLGVGVYRLKLAGAFAIQIFR